MNDEDAGTVLAVPSLMGLCTCVFSIVYALQIVRFREGSAAHHQPREGPRNSSPPRVRCPAHPKQLPRPDEPAERGDDGPYL